METESRRLGDMIHKELDISKSMSSRSSRSDSRRAVEDVFEVKRYKEMHEDLYDF